MDNDELFTLAMACEYLHLSEDCLRKYCREGRISYLKIGRHYRFKKEFIDEFINRRTVHNPVAKLTKK